MAEELTLAGGSKADRYAALLPQIEAVMQDESDLIANMANVASMLWETFAPSAFPLRQTADEASVQSSARSSFSWMWVGFYRVVDGELVLGPFQGPMACTRIRYGRGVCGTAWAQGCTQVVPDVELFPGHIACSSASRSEIVVPMISGGEVVAVLDIDSQHLNTFDHTDQIWLERIVALLTR